MARKFGKNVIMVTYNKKNFKEDNQSYVFKTLKIKERYFFNKKPIRRFIQLGFFDSK
jgi:hypothetical protein